MSEKLAKNQANRIKLTVQLMFIVKRLRKYMSDDEIAHLIAVGLQKEDANNEIA